MKTVKTAFAAAAILWSLCVAEIGSAQSTYRNSRAGGAIDAGTTITVRTNEGINAKDSDGRIYSGVVEQDVMNGNGNIAIPKGSDVELVVKRVADNEVALDLDSVMVNGQRYGIQSEDSVVNSERKEGIGANKRTGKYVGGGAVLGAIIGAIAGGGKGAAIGAGAGAAAGAGAQVLTRGKSVEVPAESLLTFRLTEPLQAGLVDNGYTQNGVHYHSGPGYSDVARQKPGYYSNGNGTISIGSDNNVTWQGPQNSSVYVQVDNEAPKLFAGGQSGTQAAPWIVQGHNYVFILKDANGNEVARDQVNLRNSRNRFRR